MGSGIHSPIFRKSFMLDAAVVSAQLVISGLGYYEASINGRRVGDHVLDPAFTAYDRRVLYVTYDVTGHLSHGENVIGVMLGNGWYNSHTKDAWHFETAPWRDAPKLLCQLHITHVDGRSEVICSDTSWQVSTGPIVFDGVRNGETYDARLEKHGWDTPAYRITADWDAAEIITGPGGCLEPQHLPPIKVIETITPVSIVEVTPGVFIVDMGRNIAGWAQLTVSGTAGTEVTLRYSERLGAEGNIDQHPLNTLIISGEFQTDRYILKGEGTEVWESRFTYHGFRYVQVTGFPGTPTVDTVRGRVVQTAFTTVGTFECSNPLLQSIQQCTVQAYASNFHGIPTDCPHREKNGWTADAHLAVETGLLNFHAATAYAKWLDDIADVQRPSGAIPGIVPTSGWGWEMGPAWDAAYLLIPWALYQYTGDRAVLARHSAGMRRYVDFLATTATDYLVSWGLGDWCPPQQAGSDPRTPATLTSTAYYFLCAHRLAEMAAILGIGEDAPYYADLSSSIRQAFNARFFDPVLRRYIVDTQAAVSLALDFGLVDESHIPTVVTQLLETVRRADDHVDCGFLGAKSLLRALSDHGHADLAYRVATQTTFPGWGHMVAQGATTLWETWDGSSSLNHVAFGDISAWMYRTLAGIRPLQPGFKEIIIVPQPVGGLTWVRAEHDSPFGVIRSAWSIADEQFQLDVTIPPNSTAHVQLPNGCTEEVTEGTHTFTVEHSQDRGFTR